MKLMTGNDAKGFILFCIVQKSSMQFFFLPQFWPMANITQMLLSIRLVMEQTETLMKQKELGIKKWMKECTGMDNTP